MFKWDGWAYVGTLRSLLGWFPKYDRDLAYATLWEFGLADRALQRADRLSGGERQRVAIARALTQRPKLVLADEPAASLDISLTRFVLETLHGLNRDQGLTVVVNLHNLHLARTYASRILALRDGCLVFDGTPAQLTDAIQQEVYHGRDSTADIEAREEWPARRSAATAS
jgi:phosphonate transport system ATP-binding protein